MPHYCIKDSSPQGSQEYNVSYFVFKIAFYGFYLLLGCFGIFLPFRTCLYFLVLFGPNRSSLVLFVLVLVGFLVLLVTLWWKYMRRPLKKDVLMNEWCRLNAKWWWFFPFLDETVQVLICNRKKMQCRWYWRVNLLTICIFARKSRRQYSKVSKNLNEIKKYR